MRIEPDGPSQQIPTLHGRPGELSAQTQRLNLVRIESQSLESLFAGLIHPADIAQADRQQEVHQGDVGEGGAHSPGLGERALRLTHVAQKGDPVPGDVEVRPVPGPF